MSDSSLLDEDKKYSHNRIIRLISGFPENRPLPCRYEHGHCPSNDKPVNDLKSKKNLMLVFNRRRLTLWQKYSKKKAYIIGSLFVQYRRFKNICKADAASGTVAFPLHSTLKEEGVFDREEYCRKLKELPETFHPIKICVHEHDIQRGFDKIYRGKGFEIVTAGIRENPDFVDKFYDIVRHCKYATSNAFGSYLFYTVEMGIPFFIYGPEASIRYTDRDIPIERATREEEYGGYIERLFSTYPDIQITAQQRIAVAEETGIEDAISSDQLHQLLMSHYWRQRLEDAIRFPFRHPKKFLQRLLYKCPLVNRSES